MSARVAPPEHASRWPRSAEGWLAHLQRDDVGVEAEKALAVWLDEAPDNRESFERLRSVWLEAGALRSDPMVIEALRGTGDSGADGFGIRRSLVAGLAAAAILVVAVVGVWMLRGSRPSVSRDERIVAIQGTQVDTELADGSRVLLNSGATLRVAGDLASAASRVVELEQGEALFEVRRTDDRSFVVLAGDQQVRVLGTRFVVRRQKDCVSVGVFEGSVRVASTGGGAEHELAPEEGLICGTGAAAAVVAAFLGRVEAWREGRVVFEDTPLSDAIEEINLYAQVPWRLRDPSLDRLRITGSYFVESLAEPETLAFALERTLGVDVELRDDEVTVGLR